MDKKNSLTLEDSFLDSLSVAGGNIFIAGFEHGLANKFSDFNPAYNGKRLGDIALEITHEITPEMQKKFSLPIYEKAKFQIIQQESFEFSGENSDLHKTIAAEAMFYADIKLSDDFKIDKNRIWHRAINTKYSAKQTNSNTIRTADTFLGGASVQLIEEALSYCDKLEAYVRSTDFEVYYDTRKIRAEKYSDDLMPFSHKWTLPYKPGLTFNGYESKSYLRQYVHYAERTIKEQSVNLSMLTQIDPNDDEALVTIEELAIELAELKTSLASARQALENNKLDSA